MGGISNEPVLYTNIIYHILNWNINQSPYQFLSNYEVWYINKPYKKTFLHPTLYYNINYVQN